MRRNFIISIVLVSIIFAGFFVSRKSLASGVIESSPSFAYKFIVIAPSGKSSEVVGTSRSLKVEVIAKDLGITINPEDRASTLPDPEARIGSVITVHQAPAITIIDGKKAIIFRSWLKTAGELLTEKNIELGTDDKTNFKLDSAIADGDKIIITRVAITNIVETKPIAFQIVNKDDPNLDYGKKRTEAGINGEKKLTYRVRREDGEEVERTLLSTEITKEAKTEIHYTGTKVTVLSSVRGRATMTLVSNYVVSGISKYPKGTLIRISSGNKSIIVSVNATWGNASPPDGVVLDLSQTYLTQLGCPSAGCSNVLVEELKQ
ncbi:MAG: G5 domain-containing protein [Candidatus Berkelbacteria bacterium]|nr:G5 domain-containing protein [Candidatus Berkelbacteria bacterium]